MRKWALSREDIEKRPSKVQEGLNVSTQLNPRGRKAAPLDGQQRGPSPSKHWELDLIEVTPTRFNYQYLLVF